MTAGYSGTPLPKKLGIGPEHLVLVDAAPDGFDLAPLPDGVRLHRRAGREPIRSRLNSRIGVACRQDSNKAGGS